MYFTPQYLQSRFNQRLLKLAPPPPRVQRVIFIFKVWSQNTPSIYPNFASRILKFSPRRKSFLKRFQRLWEFKFTRDVGLLCQGALTSFVWINLGFRNKKKKEKKLRLRGRWESEKCKKGTATKVVPSASSVMYVAIPRLKLHQQRLRTMLSGSFVSGGPGFRNFANISGARERGVLYTRIWLRSCITPLPGPLNSPRRRRFKEGSSVFRPARHFLPAVRFNFVAEIIPPPPAK